MAQVFDSAARIHVTRDSAGIVRELLHSERVFVPSARIPQLAAREYIEHYGEILGVRPAELRGEGPARHPIQAGVEYRFLQEKNQFDTVTVVFSQTYLGLPVWEAGIAVHMRRNPLTVVGAQSTRHADIQVEVPSEAALRRVESLSAAAVAGLLGADGELVDRGSLKIKDSKLVVYRYQQHDRIVGLASSVPIDSDQREVRDELVPRLSPLPAEIEEGGHYVAREIVFTLGTPTVPGLTWVVLVEPNTSALLLIRSLAANVCGCVFKHDPATDHEGPPPSASNADLNEVRTSVLLAGISPPVGGSYSLVGNNVRVGNNPPPLAPVPTEPCGTDFDFDARTNDFAAVNAYYHCDRFFRLVADLGFDITTYFGGTNFPLEVDHRARIFTSDGIEINAFTVGNGTFGVNRILFALADTTDTTNPIGVACDYRVALHELGGHGILYNHINYQYFKFAHSAGDSIGVIVNDPESLANDRYATFPWTPVPRRHDRGWGWSGDIALHAHDPVKDPKGYNTEQILSTTHFRLYRALGGDSSEVAMRLFAADYVVYLIFRAVGMLTPHTQPNDAEGWANMLMFADAGDWRTKDAAGGCYWKVIRWAFEKQGLYQPPLKPKPNDDPGAPPDIDVYIDDSRGGEYDYVVGSAAYKLQRFWNTTEIWNRHQPDGQLEHQTPVVGVANHAYVRVKNRGQLPASEVTIRGFHSRPAAGLVWPDDFKPMRTPARTVPGPIPSGGMAVAGPFEWYPEHHGHECIFMTASTFGDLANNDPATGSRCSAGPTPLWRMVPTDNNQALRGVIPVPGGGNKQALVAAFRYRSFWACNPLDRSGRGEVRPMLPAFLIARGWTLRLDNPGGGSFTLGPRASRQIRPRLIAGQDFTAAEVIAAGTVAIEMVVLVEGLVVGGLSYVLDPQMKHPARERHDGQDEQSAEGA